MSLALGLRLSLENERLPVFVVFEPAVGVEVVDEHGEGDEDDPEIDYKMNFTFNKAQKREVRAALSNTFGFGGHNACVIFKKYAE